MKNLFILLAVFSIAFVIGCQENTITDPLSPESPVVQAVNQNTAVKNLTPDKDIPIVLRFENELTSPYLSFYPECFTVAGEVAVQHKVDQLDPFPPNPQYRVTVGLSMDAELSCGEETARNRWFVKTDTKNTLFLNGDVAAPLTIYYTFSGRSDRMQLGVTYSVSLDGVSITSMKLRIPDYDPQKIHNNL